MTGCKYNVSVYKYCAYTVRMQMHCESKYSDARTNRQTKNRVERKIYNLIILSQNIFLIMQALYIIIKVTIIFS